MSRYSDILAEVFKAQFKPGTKQIEFARTDLDAAADKLGIDRIKNLGDIVYSVRYRENLPETIQKTAPSKCEWVIIGAGKGLYQFRVARAAKIIAADPATREQIKILDSTPEVLTMYAPSRDEQALLTRVRYNRILDIFFGLTCYSIQNHYRTTVEGLGQVEVDEVYIGFGKQGAHFVLPCQAKSPGDKFGIVQVHQDAMLCRQQYRTALVRPVALQFTGQNSLAVLELTVTEVDGVLALQVVDEKHYLLVRAGDLRASEIMAYNSRA